MSAKPTPTPWVADIDETAVIRDSHGNQIAMFTFMNTKTGGRRSAEEVIASTRTAVRCVNAMPAMVEALEDAADFVDAELVAKIRAALALAKGE